MHTIQYVSGEVETHDLREETVDWGDACITGPGMRWPPGRRRRSAADESGGEAERPELGEAPEREEAPQGSMQAEGGPAEAEGGPGDRSAPPPAQRTSRPVRQRSKHGRAAASEADMAF
jgi:hypothetical protein